MIAAGRVFQVADLFCGAGGTSSGAVRAVRAFGAELDLIAVNHWDVAIATHTRNHPGARHFCVNLDAARPETLVPGGKLDLLLASPECVHHSRARGGKPVSDQRRMSAWHVNRWASALDIRCILVENVPEFQWWGPVVDGKPDPDKKGWYFQAWLKSLWEMGYVVDWRLLNAADYGDATTRTRFFLQARKDGRPIQWPEPTHCPTGAADLLGDRPRWRAAREIIDWSNPGHSLLARKRPLSLKTRLRIARGLERFGGRLAPLYIRLLDLPDDYKPQSKGDGMPLPFVFANRENNVARDIDTAVPTITTTPGGGGLKLVQPTAEPFVLGQQGGSVARSVESPIPTVTTDGYIRVIEPQLLHYYGTDQASSVNDPLPTVTTKPRFGLTTPMVVPYYGDKNGQPRTPHSPEEPLATVTAEPRFGLCTPSAEPFLVPQFGEAPNQRPRVHDVEAPLPAVTSHGAGCLVQPVVLKTDQTHQAGPGVRSVDAPLFTMTTKAGMALAEPTAEPATSQDVDPRRLAVIDGQLYLLDIRFRMLSNRELARAMGFDDAEAEYEFEGTIAEVTRQIGNAVPVNLAAALVTAILCVEDGEA